MEHDCGISELIGTVVLIGIIVTVIGYMTVIIFSQPAVEYPPAVVFDNRATADSLELIHSGGDTLDMDQLKIIVDGVDQTKNLIRDSGDNPDYWSIGEKLIIRPDRIGDVSPSAIQVIYRGKGTSEYLLYSIGEDRPCPGPTTEPTHEPEELHADFTFKSTGAPFEIQFTDTTTGTPLSWSWDFGDNRTSTAQNPVHSYASFGTYTVTLKVSDTVAEDTAVHVVDVQPSAVHDVYLNTNRGSYLEEGNYLSFRVAGDWSYIWLNGNLNTLKNGSVVKLVINSNQSGTVYVASDSVTTLDFDDVSLYIDGVFAGSGEPDIIWISSYDELKSTLSLVVPYSAGVQTYLEVDDQTLINYWPVNSSEIRIHNMVTNSDGVFNLVTDLTYLKCGAERYEIITTS